MASTYITRTLGSGAATTKMTYSTWLKGLPTTLTDGTKFFACDGTGATYFRFNTSYTLEVSGDGSPYDDSMGYLVTNRVFRDNAAWIHIVIRFDSTESAANDRLRIYINGVDERGVGGYASDTMPNTDAADNINLSGNVHRIGGTSAQYWAGLMSHTHLCIGYSYAPTEFGEVDATSGMWKIKTSPSVSYGTNGWFLKMEDSSNMDLDSSPNALTFATTGNLTATKDNPDNNFTTLEGGLVTPNSSYDPVYSNGNNTVITSHTTVGHDFGGCSTLGLQAGLWYWEIYINDMTGDSIQGVYADPNKNARLNTPIGYYAGDMGYVQAGQYITAGTATSWGSSYTAGDYIGCYLDLTANKMYFAKNGTIQESGVGLTMTAPADLTGNSPKAYFPGSSAYTTGASKFDFNFGNGYFGTSAISGASADEGGEGQFKYNPSTGSFDSSSKDFRAICTKNIKLYGG